MTFKVDIIKIIGVGLIALIIIIILKQYRPEFVVYVSIVAGVIIIAMIANPIIGIVNYIYSISNKTNVNTEFIKILIKITGIAILTEFAVSISNDCGETAIANKIDVGGKVIIISLSIPIVQALMETVINILP